MKLRAPATWCILDHCHVGRAEGHRRALEYQDPTEGRAPWIATTVLVRSARPPPGDLRAAFARSATQQDDALDELLLDQVDDIRHGPSGSGGLNTRSRGSSPTSRSCSPRSSPADTSRSGRSLRANRSPPRSRDRPNADSSQARPWAERRSRARPPSQRSRPSRRLELLDQPRSRRRSLPRLERLRIRSRIIAASGPRRDDGIEWQADRRTGDEFKSVGDVKRRAVEIGHARGVHFFGGPPSTLIWIPPSNIDDDAMNHCSRSSRTWFRSSSASSPTNARQATPLTCIHMLKR